MNDLFKEFSWGELLDIIKTPINMNDDDIYSLASIRRRNGGFFHRGKKIGKEILTKTLSKAVPGAFTISKMQVVHGACGYVPESFSNTFLSSSYIQFQAKNPPKIDTKYLNYYSYSHESYSAFLKSSHGVHIEKMTFDLQDWLKQKISLPSLKEQKKIVSILNSVDEIIEITQKKIDKLQDLRKATLDQLLTKGVDHKEFKDSELGKIPKSWSLYELGELCIFTQGIQISLEETLTTNQKGYIRYLYINDFSSEKKLRFIKDKFPTKIVSDQDLVMANTGHSSGTVFRGKHGVLSNNAFKITIKKSIKSEYLFYYLSTRNYWFKIRKLFNTAGQPHVGHTNIAKLKFLCPPLDEQDKIISMLHRIDQNIINNQKKLSQTQSLKKSLMQDLLTGKVRVKVN